VLLKTGFFFPEGVVELELESEMLMLFKPASSLAFCSAALALAAAFGSFVMERISFNL
jgi:hypothetical protein